MTKSLEELKKEARDEMHERFACGREADAVWLDALADEIYRAGEEAGRKWAEEHGSPYIGHCNECAFYLDYKDDWQCNGGAMSEECKCHPEIPKEAARTNKQEV